MHGAARAAGLQPGTRLGRYTLLRRLAVGGMAELYIAHQRGAAGFTKIVALKRILPHLAEDPTFTRMFLDEARLASGLDHPNLAHVLDFGEYDGEHFLTMEYVHGRNLLEVLRAQQGLLPLSSALSIVTRVARGLHDLHEQRSPDGRALGLVHRDVSPSNVLVAFDGKVKLTDFGIAKAMALTSATRSGTFKGKLGHSSPEQVRGEAIDRRSDVFCLGILLYEATTGARAFSGPNEFAVLGKVARGDCVPPSDVSPNYPPALAAIVARALQVEPQARYPTAVAVAEALEDFARRNDLRLTTEAVADTMRGIFGPTPPVVVEQELLLASRDDMQTAALEGSGASGRYSDSGVLTARTTVGDARPSRRSGVLLLVVPLAVAAGAGGAMALGRGATAEALPTQAPAVSVPHAADVRGAAQPTSPPRPAAAAPQAVAVDATPDDPAPAPPPEPTPAVDPVAARAAPAATTTRTRPGRKKRRKPTPKSPPKPETKKDELDALYPPGR